MDAKIIWDFLMERINNAYGVSALMGNLYVESHLNPMDLQGSYERKLGMTDQSYTDAVDYGSYTREQFINDSAGYGLAQWTYWSRKEALYDYAKSVSVSIGDLNMQLNYLWDELQKYKTVLNALYTATSVREASDVVVKRYENPKNQTEEFLENRAKYGRDFYNTFAEATDMVNSWEKVQSMLSEWKSKGLKKPEIVVKLANACIGWNYIFGDRGEQCVPSHVKSRISAQQSSQPRDAEALKKRCQVANGSKKDCKGCKFYPNSVTLAYDCRGFTYWCFLKGAGITINGAGATSQYNDNSNWAEKGTISKMPKNKVCCTFRYDSSTGKYEHTLIYDGAGHYIHDSGEVKKCDIDKYKATHYAIPKGLYSSSGSTNTNGGGGKVVQAKVWAANGTTVNMRASASISSALVMQVPIGAVVDVSEQKTDWCKISYDGRSGYMMTKFLNFGGVSTSSEYVSVKKSELQSIYDMIGKMLKG